MSETPETPRILIACVGNIFHGDDAFGVEVAKAFAGRTLPPTVRVEDFGIRGLDLTYALLGGCDAAIIVDACPRGGSPGTLYVIEPQPDAATGSEPTPENLTLEAHAMNPDKVLRAVRAMGGGVQRVLVVGCEPAKIDPDEMSMEISPPVLAAVEPAVALIESLVEKLMREEVPATRPA